VWQLEHGPVDRLPTLASPNWTVLIQGLDLVSPGAKMVLEQFRWIADARLDDAMVSIAGPGGGVGPHLDSYDVFLLQVSGARRWDIASPAKLASNELQPAPIKLLKHFKSEAQKVLLPGDMLYLPPGWGHDGVAVKHPGASDESCVTLSIGFRAPSRHEFLGFALMRAAESLAGTDPRFSDPGRKPTRLPAQIPQDLLDILCQWAEQWRADPKQLKQWCGEFLSEPKEHVWFESNPPMAAAAFIRRLLKEGIRLALPTRMLYFGGHLYVNGEKQAIKAHALLKRLADQGFLLPLQCLDLGQKSTLNDNIVGELRQWHANGWLQLGAIIEGFGDSSGPHEG
jgi:50S ribosomal protein L16 3-hydroxylase